jgi:hypothetical protein
LKIHQLLGEFQGKRDIRLCVGAPPVPAGGECELLVIVP